MNTISKKRLAWALVISWICLAIWPQASVKQLSVMEEPISAPNALVDEGKTASAPFPSHDIVGICKDIDGRLKDEDVRQYVQVRQMFDEHPYLSSFRQYRLSLDTTDYARYEVWDGEKVLVKKPYLTAKTTATEFVQSINGNKGNTAGDSVMRNLLYNPEMSKLCIIWQPPKGFDQATFIWSMREVLTGRTFNWFERSFVFTDPEPLPEYVAWFPFGWTSGRQQIQDGMPKESSNYTTIGFVLSFLIFWLSTGSLKFAGAGVGFLVLMIAGIRAAIVPLSYFMIIAERPFVVLAYSNTIIQGQSLVLYASYIMREPNQDQRRTMRLVMSFIVFTGLSNLGIVWWAFGVRPIEEMAALSMVGLLQAYVVARWIIPALVQKLPDADDREVWRITRWIHQRVDQLVGERNRGTAIALLVLACVTGPIAFVNLDVGSNPLDFFHGTRAWEGMTRLQNSGLGADGIYGRIECQVGERNFLDPACLDAAWKFKEALEADPDNVKVASILDTVVVISNGEYGSPVPPDQKTVRYVWDDIEDTWVEPGIRRNLYTADYRFLRVIAMQKETGTSETTANTMAVIKSVASRFPEITVNRGGPSALFAETDRLIKVGEKSFIVGQLTSNWFWYMLLCHLLIGRWKKRWCLGLRLSAFRLALVASLPFAFATGGVVGLMWLAHVPFDLATAAILAMANSASNDMTMYYLARWIDWAKETGSTEVATNETVEEKGEQVATDCALNASCFSPLLLSNYGPIAQIGWLMPGMLGLCGLGLFKIMVPLMGWTVIKNKER